MIVSCVLEAAMGANPEGTVLQLDEETANALVDAKLARHATAEDVGQPKEEEPIDELEPDEEGEDTPEAVEESVNRITRSASDAVKKGIKLATEKYIAQATKNVNRPSLIPTNRHVAGSDELITGGFKSLGDASAAWLRKSSGDFEAAKKFARYERAVYASSKATGMSIAGTHVGSDLVPQQWAEDLWRLSFKNVPNLLEMPMRYEMRNQVENIAVTVQATAVSGITGAITPETTTASPGTIAASTQPTATVQLALSKIAALVNVSDELLRFNSYNLESTIKQVVPERFRYYLNQYIINGGGGTHLNLVGNAATVYCGRQTANTINPRDIYNMESMLWDSYSEEAVWLVSPKTAAALSMMSFPNSSATTQFPVFMGGSFGANLAERPLQTLLGKPVYKIENCPALGSTGDIILWHPGSCAAGYTGLIADQTPYLYFNLAQNTFRFLLYSTTVNPLTVPYTRQDGSFASNIVVLDAGSLNSI